MLNKISKLLYGTGVKSRDLKAVEKSFTIMGMFRFAEKAESVDAALKLIEKNG